MESAVRLREAYLPAEVRKSVGRGRGHALWAGPRSWEGLWAVGGVGVVGGVVGLELAVRLR